MDETTETTATPRQSWRVLETYDAAEEIEATLNAMEEDGFEVVSFLSPHDNGDDGGKRFYVLGRRWLMGGPS